MYMMNSTPPKEKRFVYFYLNRNEPGIIKQVVSAHVQYWETAERKGYMVRTLLQCRIEIILMCNLSVIQLPIRW